MHKALWSVDFFFKYLYMYMKVHLDMTFVRVLTDVKGSVTYYISADLYQIAHLSLHRLPGCSYAVWVQANL